MKWCRTHHTSLCIMELPTQLSVHPQRESHRLSQPSLGIETLVKIIFVAAVKLDLKSLLKQKHILS